jgi:two-component system sensor histidine kinase/response regulator
MKTQILPRAAAADWPIFTIGFGLLAVLLVAWNVNREFLTQRAEAEFRLQSVADMRSSDVESWISRKMDLAAFFGNSTTLGDQFLRWRRGDAAAGNLLLQRSIDYRKVDDDDDVLILDSEAGVLAGVLAGERPGERAISESLRAAVSSALSLRRPTHTAIEASEDVVALSMDIVVPLLTTDPSVQGLLVFRVDVKRALMPLLARWPVPSGSGRSTLWERHEDQLLAVGDVESDGIVTHPSSTEDDAPIVKLVRRGEQTAQAVRSIDRRGVEVLATVRPVAGGDWWLVSKLDVREIDRPSWAAASWTLAAASFATLGVASLGRLMALRRILNAASESQRDDRRRLRALGLLESITRSSREAIFAKDRQGRYMFCNRGAAQVIGRTPDQVIGRTDIELFGEAIGAKLANNDAAAMAGDGPKVFEESLPTPQGGFARSFCAKGPLRAHDGALLGMFGIAHDTSELRRIELAMLENASYLQRAVAVLRTGIAVSDPWGDVIQSNPAAAGFAGLTVSGWEGRPIAVPGWIFRHLDGSVVLPEEMPTSRAFAVKAAQERVILRASHEGSEELLLDVSAVPMLNPATGRLVAVVTTYEDVTQREHVRQQLDSRHRETAEALILRTSELRASVREAEDLRGMLTSRAAPVGPAAPIQALEHRLEPILDIGIALQSANGSRSGLGRVLRRFVSAYHEGVPGFQFEPTLNTKTQWRLDCHSLRGACSTIGATSLLDQIDAIDRGLQRPLSGQALQVLGEELHRSVLVLVSNLDAELAEAAWPESMPAKRRAMQ